MIGGFSVTSVVGMRPSVWSLMMYPPKCPDHRSLVFDLALGRLDDDEAMRAEDALDTCELCKNWWSETFDCAEFKVVEDAVHNVLPAVEFPPRSTRRNVYVQRWIAAAAAALVIGIGALWQTSGPRIQQVKVAAEKGITTMDFEGGQVGSQLDFALRAESDSGVVRAATASEGSAIFGEKLADFDFESGDLAGFSPQT